MWVPNLSGRSRSLPSAPVAKPPSSRPLACPRFRRRGHGRGRSCPTARPPPGLHHRHHGRRPRGGSHAPLDGGTAISTAQRPWLVAADGARAPPSSPLLGSVPQRCCGRVAPPPTKAARQRRPTHLEGQTEGGESREQGVGSREQGGGRREQ